jgi:hypothetical protein
MKAEAIPMLSLGAAKQKTAPAKVPSKKVAPGKAVPANAAGPMDTYVPPTHGDRLKSSAQHAHADATSDWVSGRISTAKHKQVTGRAQKVINMTKKMPTTGRF